MTHNIVFRIVEIKARRALESVVRVTIREMAGGVAVALLATSRRLAKPDAWFGRYRRIDRR